MRVTLGVFLVGGVVVVELAADDVGVHASAGDVLADRIDDEQIDFVKGQARHPFLGEDLAIPFRAPRTRRPPRP